MKNSKIEWTHHTFNPWWGCTKVSPACEHCYAEAFAKRTGHDVWGPNKPRRFFGPKHWEEPLKWNATLVAQASCLPVAGASQPRERVFCASMADVFEHYEGPSRTELASERSRLWKLIEQTPNLDWLLLTKRPENILKMVPRAWLPSPGGEGKGDGLFPSNIWIGTTVENQEQANKRIPELLKVPARIRFLSCEPLLGKVRIFNTFTGDLEFWSGLEEHSDHIDWIICGGESGPGSRPMDPSWARSLRDQCQIAHDGVPFFFKQWGDWLPHRQGAGYLNGYHELREFAGVNVFRVGKAKSGRLLDGKEYNEVPL